jgi:hypothetical protein
VHGSHKALVDAVSALVAALLLIPLRDRHLTVTEVDLTNRLVARKATRTHGHQACRTAVVLLLAQFLGLSSVTANIFPRPPTKRL